MQMIYPLSRKYLLVAPLVLHVISLSSLAGIFLLRAFHIDTVVAFSWYDLSYTQILIGSFCIVMLSFLLYVFNYFRYRDTFLVISSQGIMVAGVSIPWKCLESKILGSRLIIHVTNQSQVDLGKLIWLGRGKNGGIGVIALRGDLYLPDWLFDAPLQEIVHAMHTAEPQATKEYIAEKMHTKQSGREFVMKKVVSVGLVITCLYAVFIVSALVRDGWRVSDIFLPLVFLSAIWFAILSTFSDRR